MIHWYKILHEKKKGVKWRETWSTYVVIWSVKYVWPGVVAPIPRPLLPTADQWQQNYVADRDDNKVCPNMMSLEIHEKFRRFKTHTSVWDGNDVDDDDDNENLLLFGAKISFPSIYTYIVVVLFSLYFAWLQFHVKPCDHLLIQLNAHKSFYAPFVPHPNNNNNNIEIEEKKERTGREARREGGLSLYAYHTKPVMNFFLMKLWSSSSSRDHLGALYFPIDNSLPF